MCTTSLLHTNTTTIWQASETDKIESLLSITINVPVLKFEDDMELSEAAELTRPVIKKCEIESQSAETCLGLQAMQAKHVEAGDANAKVDAAPAKGKKSSKKDKDVMHLLR
jgi:hypothetical protein